MWGEKGSNLLHPEVHMGVVGDLTHKDGEDGEDDSGGDDNK